jgi:hypothetical protein
MASAGQPDGDEQKVKRSTGVRSLAIAALLCLGTHAAAQQPVYRCNGTYTDQPCAGGREVDIRPTEGAHSMSGRKKQSLEAQLRDANRAADQAFNQGVKQANTAMHCQQLQKERMRLDRTSAGTELEGRRLEIRQQQFKLGCRRN